LPQVEQPAEFPAGGFQHLIRAASRSLQRIIKRRPF
jgi:hypothetical protein